MKRINILVLIGLFFSACSTPAAPAATSTPEPINTSTNQLIPTVRPSPQSTFTPNPPKIPAGKIFEQWSVYTDDQNSPYVVWGARLRESMNGNCEGFICAGKDLRLYDPTVWKFLGRGEYGKKTFTFTEPLDTFVITFSKKMGFDALSGITPDGKTVTYGYLTNGKVTTSYMDSGGFPMRTIIEAENTNQPVKTPCGINDPNPDGDKSYNMGEGQGGIVFNFLDRAWGQQPYLTKKGYQLMSLTIVSAPASEITPTQICP